MACEIIHKLEVGLPEVIIPPREVPEGDDGYLEQMTKAIFQAGFSWKVVNEKWPSFRRAFKDFSVEQVAAFSPADVDALVQDASIVRNRRKIEAAVWNARKILALRAEFGSLQSFLRSLDGSSYREVNRTLQATFEHLGRTGAFVFLWCVGEEVPDWEDR
jgi:3-methyladenine DNA glycosylase Tag